jgi:MFS family permease
VPGSLRQSLSESLGAFRAVLGNRNLRLVESAGAAAETAKWLYIIALMVYAYDVGGASAVGVVSLIRIVPAALIAPFAAVFTDRFPRQRVMLLTAVTRTLAFGGATAAVALNASSAVVYVIAGVVTLLSTVFRPAEAAILPSLARTPEELTAANVAASTIVSLGSLAGPAIGGVLLAATSVETVFAVTAATFLLAAVLLAWLPVDPRPERPPEEVRFTGEALAGFRTIVTDRHLRVLVGLYGAQTLVAGALGVLIVVAAIRLLGIGESGVGYLNSAFGVGGLVGVGVTFVLVARQRLGSDFAVGMMLWGIPLIILGVWPRTAVALIAITLIGIGDVLVEVAAPTLLQRAVPDEVLGRVFGALESVLIGMMGLGAIVAPALVSGLGTRGALIATGALLPVLAVLFWRPLAAIDAESRIPVHEIALLRRIPIFAPLPLPRIEELASRLVPLTVPAATEVFRQGERGDRFYVIDDGEVEVSIDGAPVRREGPGEYFGEIALLHDVPRTGTVVAATDTKLYHLDRDEFLGAITGHAESRTAVETVAGARLATAKPPGLALE